MKYIRVAVPDEFDPGAHTMQCNMSEELALECDTWQPKYVNVLDKGFLGLIDFMGDDQAVVNAARVSYGAGTRRVSEDKGLIRYLMRHRHTTPFEMAEFKFHARMPIFVARQWIRHRTASVNEYSGRYSVMTEDAYMPDPSVMKPQSKTNRQGRGGNLSDNNSYACQLQLQHIYQETAQAYRYLLGQSQVPSTALNTRYDIVKQFAMDRIEWLEQNDPAWKPDLVTDEMIDEKIKEIVVANGLAFTDDEFWGEDGEGLSRELARIGLTVATYTEWYWKANLKNILHFISLRSDPHAQYEIRAYSDAMLEMIRPIVPLAVEAFIDYQMEGRSFSRMELAIVRDLYQRSWTPDTEARIKVDMASNGAGKREITEFMEMLNAHNENVDENV